MYHNILVPTDGSALSNKAVTQAGTLAKALGAKLILFHAAHHYQTPHLTEGMSSANVRSEGETAKKEMEAEASRTLATAAKNANLKGVNVEQQSVVGDYPFEAIIDGAEKNHCDLIMMASHGRRGISGMILGSETQKVLAHSKIPVLVVR